MLVGNVGNLLIFREKVLDHRPKSVCAVEMTMYVLWTCINVNRKDVHAWMISFNGKICIKNLGVWHSFEKMKLQLCFFLKKPSLVFIENTFYPKNSIL